MTRTILAIATAFLAAITAFGSAAQACISCEHVPVVIRGHTTSDTATYYAKKRRAKTRAIAGAKAKAKAQAIARAKAKAQAVAAAKTKAEAKKVAAVALEADEDVAETENSTISATDDARAEASTDEPAKVVAAAEELTCKKFFPTVSMTLTVPCD